MTRAKKDDGGFKVKIALLLWGLLVHWLATMAEDKVRELREKGLAKDRAEAIAALVEWFEVILAGPWGQALVRSIAVNIAIPAVAKVFPNDPSTGSWGGA